MKKILIVDNHIETPGCPEIELCLENAAKKMGAIEITTLRGPDSKLPKSPAGFDAVVISGSLTRIGESAPWIDAEIDFVRRLYEEKVPTLAICYGEQLIARMFGGQKTVGEAKTGEHGWYKIELTPEAKNSKVFSSLPQSFYSFQAHNDEVYSLPKNCVLMAKNENCAVQAYDVMDAPMWAVQFHPERPLKEGNEGLDRRIAKGKPAAGRDIAEKVFDPAVAAHIFGNFLREVWQQR